MLLLRLFLSFMKIGFCSFGGMTMIPVINDEVLRYGWMTEIEVMDIAAVAEMTPGSLGINCATFVGLRTAGTLGAIAASLGVMMPSLTLCMITVHFLVYMKGNRWVESALCGIRPASLGMLLAAALTLGMSTFTPYGVIKWNLIFIAAMAGFLMFRFKLTIPKTILVAAILGLLFG